MVLAIVYNYYWWC